MGHSIYCMQPTATNIAFTELGTITRREREVLHLMGQGKSSKEIASCLHISVQTVQKHTKNAYRRLGVHNKIEALIKTKWLMASLYPNQN